MSLQNSMMANTQDVIIGKENKKQNKNGEKTKIKNKNEEKIKINKKIWFSSVQAPDCSDVPVPPPHPGITFAPMATGAKTTYGGGGFKKKKLKDIKAAHRSVSMLIAKLKQEKCMPAQNTEQKMDQAWGAPALLSIQKP